MTVVSIKKKARNDSHYMTRIASELFPPLHTFAVRSSVAPPSLPAAFLKGM